MTSDRPSSPDPKRPRHDEPQSEVDEDDLLAKLKIAAEESTSKAMAAIFGIDTDQPSAGTSGTDQALKDLLSGASLTGASLTPAAPADPGSNTGDGARDNGEDSGDSDRDSASNTVDGDGDSGRDSAAADEEDDEDRAYETKKKAVEDAEDEIVETPVPVAEVAPTREAAATKVTDEKASAPQPEQVSTPATAKSLDALVDGGPAAKLMEAAMDGAACHGAGGNAGAARREKTGVERAGDGISDIQRFLSELGLETYLQAFLMNGYDTMTALRAMDREDLSEVGVQDAHIDMLAKRLEAEAPPPPPPPPPESVLQTPMAEPPGPPPPPRVDLAQEAASQAMAKAMATCTTAPSLGLNTGLPAFTQPLSLAPSIAPPFGAIQAAPVMVRTCQDLQGAMFEDSGSKSNIPAGVLAMRAKELKAERPDIPAGILAMRARAKAAAVAADTM